MYLGDWILQFQNEWNKMVIGLHVMQFCSKIILVISNQILAVHLFDFEITHLISDQIALN